MKIHVAYISTRGTRGKLPGIQDLSCEFAARIAKYAQFDLLEYPTETVLLTGVNKLAGRTKPFLAMLDEIGKALSSRQITDLIAARQQRGTQHLIFAVGGADGWTPEARGRAELLLSLGPITLQHELARVVMLEQLYRAFTILNGHPYHRG